MLKINTMTNGLNCIVISKITYRLAEFVIVSKTVAIVEICKGSVAADHSDYKNSIGVIHF